MLQKLSIKFQMLLIVGGILTLFGLLLYMGWHTAREVKEVGLQKTGAVMLELQKAKLEVASQAASTMLGHALEHVTDKNRQIEIITRMVDQFRFEEDRSGYFFVLEGTTTIALPPKKELQGKDIGDLKDKNGVYFMKELYAAVQNGGGFVSYIWAKPGAGDMPKLSYATKIPGTDFWMGCGIYVDNIQSYQSRLATKLGALTNKKTFNAGLLACVVFCAIISTAVEEQNATTQEIATNIFQSSQGIQEVNQNVGQSSAMASRITQDIGDVNASAGEISGSSNQIKLSAADLQQMAIELNSIAKSFKI
jgi:methyl-accepting chemotaxis protein